ncbi:amino acid adenylation domain-containing protein [Nostoc sp. ChiQUE01b]|uniref:non-ribosomal peptide synthetase n=1 Tax=Nostoc sp. ChiQUE01b TaxID=3075376 RepID=UPI002AD3AD19|nr:amino acid adenylation domain-containing protein [Nostoc sp. ChiQUE01b]MDZ8257275.1 amino acid adenylation domain-containing protein [Nostoc sp. ChiQUE01b]
MQVENMEGFRLSPQQEHLWLLQQIDQSWAYRSDCAILIEGNVNISNLELALQDVVDRHEILRTSFTCLPGMTIPVQVITDSKVILEKTDDLSNLNPQQQEARIEAFFKEFSQQIFDFEQGLILHTSLVKISPEKYLLFISLPALCADSVSLNCLLQQLTISYLGNLDEELSEEPLQYADFSEWQNQILEAEETQIGRKYWQQQDFSAVTHPKLPYEKQISENHNFQPKLVNSIIAPELIANIEILADKYNTSASIFYLTCWVVLFQRLSGQSEMIVATGVDGRKYEELKGALGLFAKYLPLHCHLEDKLRFSQILQQIHESVESISKWQECFTWEQILKLDTKLDSLPFLPVGFDFAEENTKHCAGNLSFCIQKLYSCTERFNIKLSCRRKDDFLSAEFHYDSNLFSEHDITDLAEQFHKLLESATHHPEAAISELEIISDRTRHQLLFEFNQTQADYPQDKCIHHLFEEQVERTPNNIAITFSDKKLTYRELNARANQMAYYLQRLGVGKEVLVGICVERSLEMIVSILGILKAGGAYIPLDPNYPSERLAFILEDTKTPVLLTQQRLLEKSPLLKGGWGDHLDNAQTICLDTDWEIIAQESQENPSIKTHSENLAYVIYTSGSTGKPKGVQIAHRHLVNSTTARITYYQEPVSSFLLLSSFAFDSSVAGLFWTLCSGGILCLPQEGLQLDIPKLLELIVQNHVSHLLSLPSLYTILLQEAKPEQLTSLRTVIVAGESCPAELVQHHHQLPSKPSLFNEYGPTEGTVWSSVYHCHSQQTKGQVSIGQPIANTQIYLLNSHLQPVPVGVIGEVYISGDGLARGYLNQAALTSEKFIPNPFSDRPGMRLYKTGDLARYLSDGNIEFLGRLDQQVKIRGYRIELGEIEAVLSQHPEVREVVVIAQKDEVQDMRLVAYLVANQQPVSLISELRRYLLDHLPEYMIPSAFVLLKEMPLLPNGKVDRRVLPDQPQLNLEENFVAPETELEQTIAIIWQEALHVEKVGIHHNFFDLGGHSLLMVQIHSKLYQTLNKDISIVEMFQYPTISALAKHLSQQLTEKPDLQPSDDLVKTRRESRKQQRQLRQKHQETSQ